MIAKGTLNVDGDVQILGTTETTGDLMVNMDKFTVAAATGNVEAKGTLDVYGDVTLQYGSSFKVSMGDMEIAGTTELTGGLMVNTDKFTVAGGTGNVIARGTLDVYGDVRFFDSTDMTGDLKVNTDKFTVAADTGNVEIAGILALTADSGHPLTVNVDKLIVSYDGSILSAGTIATSGILSVVKDGVGAMFTVYSDTGNVEVAGDINAAGHLDVDSIDQASVMDVANHGLPDGTIVGTMQTQGSIHTSGGVGVDGNLIAVGNIMSMSSVQVFNDEDVQYTAASGSTPASIEGSIKTAGGIAAEKDIQTLAKVKAYGGIETASLGGLGGDLTLSTANSHKLRLDFVDDGSTPNHAVSFFGGVSEFAHREIELLAEEWTSVACFRLGSYEAAQVTVWFSGTFMGSGAIPTADTGTFGLTLIENNFAAPETLVTGNGVNSHFSVSGQIQVRVVKAEAGDTSLTPSGGTYGKNFVIQAKHAGQTQDTFAQANPFKVLVQNIGMPLAECVDAGNNPVGTDYGFWMETASSLNQGTPTPNFDV